MTHRKTLACLASLALAGALGFGLKSVFADGIPTPNPLYYSGTLTEGGTPVNGSRNLTVNLWLNALPTGVGENTVCTSTTVTTNVINGRFRIALNSTCKGAINANPNVFVEVAEGTTSLGRAAIGAVPYAVEAAHAVTASNAVDGGGISSALAALAPSSSVPIVTAWQSYTPMLATSDGSSISNESTTGVYRRIGDTLEIQVTVAFGGAVSSSSSNPWYLPLPNGLQVDDSKLTISSFQNVGTGFLYTATGTNPDIFALLPEMAGSNVLQFGLVGTNCNLGTGCPSGGFAANGRMFVTASVPISGWTVTP